RARRRGPDKGAPRSLRSSRSSRYSRGQQPSLRFPVPLRPLRQERFFPYGPSPDHEPSERPVIPPVPRDPSDLGRQPIPRTGSVVGTKKGGPREAHPGNTQSTRSALVPQPPRP